MDNPISQKSTKSNVLIIGRRITLKGENYTKIHGFNDASANEKTVAKSKRKTRKASVFKAFRACERVTKRIQKYKRVN